MSLKRKLEVDNEEENNKKPRLDEEIAECYCFNIPEEIWFEIFNALDSVKIGLDTTLSSVMIPLLSVVCSRLHTMANKYKAKPSFVAVEPTDWIESLTEHGSVTLFEESLKTGKRVNMRTLSGILKHDRKDLFNFVIERNTFKYCEEEVAYGSALYGRLDFMKRVHEKGYKFDLDHCLRNAIKSGSVECVKYIRELGADINIQAAVRHAIKSRNIKMVCYIVKNVDNFKGFVSTDYTAAAYKGCLDIMKHINLFIKAPDNICGYAASSGNLECLKYAFNKVKRWFRSDIESAIRSKSIECVRFAYENGCEWTKHAIIECVWTENIELLEYALKNGCPTSWQALENAAYQGWSEGLDLLMKYENRWSEIRPHRLARCDIKYLKMGLERDCKRDSIICRVAARLGKLDYLKLAHENGCPMDNRVCFLAARANSLDCLKYAHENGAYWDGEVYACAAWAMSGECLKYALEQGCPFNWNRNDGMRWKKRNLDRTQSEEEEYEIYDDDDDESEEEDEVEGNELDVDNNILPHGVAVFKTTYF